jgi:hypothetical protein
MSAVPVGIIVRWCDGGGGGGEGGELHSTQGQGGQPRSSYSSSPSTKVTLTNANRRGVHDGSSSSVFRTRTGSPGSGSGRHELAKTLYFSTLIHSKLFKNVFVPSPSVTLRIKLTKFTSNT